MFTINVVGLDKAIKDFDKFVKYNDTATRIAINDSARKARTESLLVTRKDWNIKAGDLKQGSKFKPASNKNLNAEFSMTSKSISLMKFSKSVPYVSKLTPTGKKRKGGGGVKYKLKKQRGFNTLNKSFVKKSLFGNKDLTVFTKRKSPNGADITAQFSITPSSMFKQEGADAFVKVFIDSFEKRYVGQVARLTGS